LRAKGAGVVVTLIDRPSSSAATIAWRDPTSCAYGDQTWHLVKAPFAGICAVSGCPVPRGERVYMPRLCRPAPLNASAMILRRIVEDTMSMSPVELTTVGGFTRA
jgi:hypothetical protein